MGFTLTYQNGGKEKREKFTSCYENILRANQLRKQGIKVISSQDLCPYVSLRDKPKKKFPKQTVQDFVSRVNNIQMKKHGIRERGNW